MCVPSTIATGISVLGSALGTANALSGQRAQAEHAKKQRQQAFQNAKLAEDNARKALLEGEKEKEKIILEQKALQSKKAVEYGAGNIDLAGGSPLAVLSDMAGQGEEYAQNAGEHARQKAKNYNSQAQGYVRQAGSKGGSNPFAAAQTVFSGLNSAAAAVQKTNFKRGPNYF